MTHSEWQGNTTDKTGVGIFTFDDDGIKRTAQIPFPEFRLYRFVELWAQSMAKDHTAHAVRALEALAKELK